MVLIYLLTKAACTVSGLLYPAYASYKALEKRHSEDLLTWLMFWIVMGLFTAVEFVADFLIFWVPFYFQLKLGFILWLTLPQTKGATYLYETFLHPILTRHETGIDSMLEKVRIELKKTGIKMGKRSVEALQRAAVESLTTGQFLLRDLAQTKQLEETTSSASLEETINKQVDETNVTPDVQEGIYQEMATLESQVRYRRRTIKNDIVVVDENLSYSDRDIDDLMGFDSDSDTPPATSRSQEE